MKGGGVILLLIGSKKNKKSVTLSDFNDLKNNFHSINLSKKMEIRFSVLWPLLEKKKIKLSFKGFITNIHRGVGLKQLNYPLKSYQFLLDPLIVW